MSPDEPKPDIVSWVEENLTLRSPDGRKVSPRLDPVQRAILDAISDPKVRVVHRKPGRDADLPAVVSPCA